MYSQSPLILRSINIELTTEYCVLFLLLDAMLSQGTLISST